MQGFVVKSSINAIHINKLDKNHENVRRKQHFVVLKHVTMNKSVKNSK